MRKKEAFDWRAAEFVSVSRTSRILGKSQNGVWDLINAGDLVAANIGACGRPAIVASSLAQLVDSAKSTPDVRRRDLH